MVWKTALLATLDGMELQAGQIHSVWASVLLVGTRWRILLADAFRHSRLCEDSKEKAFTVSIPAMLD